MRTCSYAIAASALLFLSGCDGFFTDPAATTGTGTATTANFAFVVNPGANTVSGFAISATGTLSVLPGAPITYTTATPVTAAAVSRGNKFLWVGNGTQIFGYSLSTAGAITPLNGGAALANANCVDMQTTPDGKWLMVLDGTGNDIDLFAIGTDGSLAANGGAPFQTTAIATPHVIRLNPAGTVVSAALGAAGEYLFSFNSSTGQFTFLNGNTPATGTGDNGIAWDPTGNYLYIARTGTGVGLVVTTVSNTGVLTPTTGTAYATGALPYSVTLDNAGKYVYVANRGDNNITAYSIGTNAALTAVTGSPFASGTAVSNLAADSTGKYLLAAAYNGTPDLTVYGFDGTVAGKLNSVTSTATGTNANFIALSH